MSEPMFVAVGDDAWVNVSHIVGVEPDPDDPKRCYVALTNDESVLVHTPVRDFLNRMTGLVWK